MIGDDLVFEQNDDPLGVGAHQNRLSGGPGIDAVAIVVGHDEAGRAGPHRLLDEPVERRSQFHQRRSFLLEDLPNRPIPELGMAGPFGVGDALVFQPGIQFLKARHLRLGPEHLVAQIADLVLNLALLPARRRRAGHRLDQVVRTHLKEAAVVLTGLADEDRLDSLPAGDAGVAERAVFMLS